MKFLDFLKQTSFMKVFASVAIFVMAMYGINFLVEHRYGLPRWQTGVVVVVLLGLLVYLIILWSKKYGYEISSKVKNLNHSTFYLPIILSAILQYMMFDGIRHNIGWLILVEAIFSLLSLTVSIIQFVLFLPKKEIYFAIIVKNEEN